MTTLIVILVLVVLFAGCVFVTCVGFEQGGFVGYYMVSQAWHGFACLVQIFAAIIFNDKGET